MRAVAKCTAKGTRFCINTSQNFNKNTVLLDHSKDTDLHDPSFLASLITTNMVAEGSC